MKIEKKSLEQLTADLENVLNGKVQGHVFTLPIGAEIFPNRLTPQIEIVLLDPEENFIAYRQKSHPEGITGEKGPWMIGYPESVVGLVSRWIGKMIEQKTNDATIP